MNDLERERINFDELAASGCDSYNTLPIWRNTKVHQFIRELSGRHPVQVGIDGVNNAPRSAERVSPVTQRPCNYGRGWRAERNWLEQFEGRQVYYCEAILARRCDQRVPLVPRAFPTTARASNYDAAERDPLPASHFHGKASI